MPNLLLIDHDTFSASIYSQTFEREGFEVQTVPTGEDGLRAAATHPDVILLDLVLPRLNGFSLLEMLKNDPSTADIPVVIFTHLAQRQDIDRCLTMGIAGYFIKVHAHPEDVVRHVKSAIRVVS